MCNHLRWWRLSHLKCFIHIFIRPPFQNIDSYAHRLVFIDCSDTLYNMYSKTENPRGQMYGTRILAEARHGKLKPSFLWSEIRFARHCDANGWKGWTMGNECWGVFMHFQTTCMAFWWNIAMWDLGKPQYHICPPNKQCERHAANVCQPKKTHVNPIGLADNQTAYVCLTKKKTAFLVHWSFSLKFLRTLEWLELQPALRH